MNNKYLIPAFALALVTMFSCTKVEPLQLQPENKYTDAYYAALKAYKKSDHSIFYMWMGDYGSPTTLANRFAGVPDSVDVVSLWGGIPPKGSFDYNEMHQMREKKGTRVVAVKIVHLSHTNSTWAKEAGVPSYFNGYAEKKGYNEVYEETYGAAIAEGQEENAAKAAAESAAHIAGLQAVIRDVNANAVRTLKKGSTAENPEWEYPEWCVYAGNNLLDMVFDNDLDGFDLDFEPDSDVLDEIKMVTLLQYMAQYLGPKSGSGKLLIVDGKKPHVEVAELLDYHIEQTYKLTSSNFDNYFNIPGWKNSQLIIAESMEECWMNGGQLMNMGAFRPSEGGRKGGVAAYHGQRDYNTTDSGSDNTVPYGHVRRAIQLQNPAVLK